MAAHEAHRPDEADDPMERAGRLCAEALGGTAWDELHLEPVYGMADGEDGWDRPAETVWYGCGHAPRHQTVYVLPKYAAGWRGAAGPILRVEITELPAADPLAARLRREVDGRTFEEGVSELIATHFERADGTRYRLSEAEARERLKRMIAAGEWPPRYL